MEFVLAPDIQTNIKKIIRALKLSHLDPKRIVCFRSFGSKSRARARIWAFPHIWQLALKLPPYYCVEILAEKFDHLKNDDKIRVLIHELLHIPHNFSGALIPHGFKRAHFVNSRSVEKLFQIFQSVQ